MRNVCHIYSYTVRPTAAFLSCSAMLSAMFAAFGLYPFGDKTLAWCDMSQQVIPLLMELKDVLSGQTGWFLNLQNAGGMSFWGVFFFFLASPFHFLVLLVEKSDIYLLVNVLVLAKLSLAAATTSVFFQREVPELQMPAHLAVCISYGLCGYGLMYYQNLVWLDMLYMFPLTMTGFIMLLDEGKVRLLTVCLTLSIIVNYYLSYMLLLGMILCGAVFIHSSAPKERRKILAGKLGFSAVAALLLTAVVWLPSLLQCLSSARTGGGVVQSVQSGRVFTNICTSLPVLFCTIGATAVPLLSRFFPKNAKINAVKACWAMTVIPMVIEPVNKLWHMGSYQAFPVRYGYMPVFFGLWFLALGLGSATKKTVKIRKRQPIWLALVLLVPLITGVYILYAHFGEISSYTSSLWVSEEGFLYLSIFWLACLITLLWVCFVYTKEYPRQFTSWALLGLVLIQSAVQVTTFVGSAANTPSRSLSVMSAAPIGDDGLYRAKQESKFTHVNLLGGLGYPTLNHYTSLTDARFLAVMKKLGYSSYWMETSGCCGTLVSDILLSNKYILDSELNWTATGSGDLGYIVPSGVLPETLELGDRILLQEELCRALTGEALFTRYTPIGGQTAKQDGKTALEPCSLRYQIQVGQMETLYFDAFDCISTSLREAINDGFSIKVNEIEIAESYPTKRCNGILKLGSFENETVTVEITVRKQMQVCSFGVWGLKDPKPLAASLANARLRYENGSITGSADVQEGQALFLSVPWYSGMKVRVNGQTVQPKQVLDCFMEIPLPDGHSQITVSYIPAGLLTGAAVSIAAAFLLLQGWLFRRNQTVAKVKDVWYRCATILLRLSFAAVILIVYLLPPVVWLTQFIKN